VGLAGHVVVGDRVTIGGMAGIHQFVHIGRFCMVGGLSKVVKDVPPFTLVDGRPARVYGLNKVGLRRNGFGSGDRGRLQAIYHELYHSGSPYREALERLRVSMGEDLLAGEIVRFADEASRGLTPWPGKLRERKIDV
jgi:UDP-N-acetylglucosamine acyltransferase